MNDIQEAIDPVVSAFEKLSIPYYIGGSIASSAFGVPRATLDVDLVAIIMQRQVTPLADYLQDKYYLDPDQIILAVKNKSSFNLIHLASMIKVDVFIMKDREYDLESFSRIKSDTLMEGDSRKYFFAAPEDIILNKLEWFHLGGEISDRQWGDILGVIRVQGESLDTKYLRSWAKKLVLTDLLEKALSQIDFPLSPINNFR